MATPLFAPPTVPLITNYTPQDADALVKMPPEGPKTISFGVNWSTDAGPNNSIEFAQPYQQVQNLTQIAAVYVDNVNCASDVSLIFPDTQFRVDVPAFTEGLFPVITTTTRFQAFASTAVVASDRTFFNVLNFYPYPFTIEKTVFATAASVTAISLNATASTNIGPPTGVFTLRSVVINIGDYTTATGQIQIQIVDSAANVLFSVFIQGAAAPGQNFTPLMLSGLNIRFAAQLTVNVAVVAAVGGGTADVSISYSNP